jgi:amino acid transporter
MDQVLAELEYNLKSRTRDAKAIMWISVISLVALVLYLVVIIYFLVYMNKLSRLKNDQSLSGVFSSMKGKTRKELKSLKTQGEPLEQRVTELLLAHRSMIIILSVVGIILAIFIGVIALSHQLGLEMV